jgi:hypothetical protein
MDLRTILTGFSLLFLIFSTNLAAEEKQPTEEQFHLAETYFNFTMGISELYSVSLIRFSIYTMELTHCIGILQEALINDSMRHPPTGPPEGIIITSILGLVHQLAILKEQPLSNPIAIPLFEKLLSLSPKNIPEAYELLMGTLDKVNCIHGISSICRKLIIITLFYRMKEILF